MVLVQWPPRTGICEGQTELGLFFFCFVSTTVFFFYVTLSWEKGKGQKEREMRVSLCLKLLRVLQCLHDKHISEQF